MHRANRDTERSGPLGHASGRGAGEPARTKASSPSPEDTERILQLAGRVKAVLQASIADHDEAKAALQHEIINSWPWIQALAGKVKLNAPLILGSAIEQVGSYQGRYQLSAIREDDPSLGRTLPLPHLKKGVDFRRQAAEQKDWWKQAVDVDMEPPQAPAGQKGEQKRDARVSNPVQQLPVEKAGQKHSREEETKGRDEQQGRSAQKRPRYSKPKSKPLVSSSSEDEDALARTRFLHDKSAGKQPQAPAETPKQYEDVSDEEEEEEAEEDALAGKGEAEEDALAGKGAVQRMPIPCDRCLRDEKLCTYSTAKPSGRCERCRGGNACSLTPRSASTNQPFKNKQAGAKAQAWRAWALARQKVNLPVPDLAVWDDTRECWMEDLITWDNRSPWVHHQEKHF
ncbi:hypothetical protein EVJ58_g11135 [Rhodofomes roseus]|uniref:Uncharacterized protein n=1 Tax=Rhodofomes roseus TaxID=34475 RepID=A0A4Y9XNW7_9APHY|nr:hypothetical protein EVJ58_g11135 [Rhodofomes roseus]